MLLQQVLQSVPDAMVNWVLVGEEEDDKDEEASEDEVEALRVLAAAAQARAAHKKQQLECVVIEPQKGKKGPPGIPAKTAPAGLSGARTVPAGEVRDSSGGILPAKEGPQFRYQAAVEYRQLIKDVIDRSLNSSITVSQKKLLAISLEMRRHMKEITTAKRVAQASIVETAEALLSFANLNLTADKGEEVVVGVDCLPLQCIDAEMEGGGKVECVLDSGTKLVIIRKGVWESLNVPMKPTQTYNLVAANQTCTSTLGKLNNIRVSFGSVTLYLQAQVIEEAPFDILLGQPFFALARAQTSHNVNGKQMITIKDLNTDEIVTLVTRQKREKERKVDFQ